MQITSPAFQNQQEIPNRYTCDGEGVNPPLFISGVPEGTKSLVLIVDDPDAPVGTFVHWLLWNISPEIQEIDEDEIPDGAVEGKNSAGGVEWIAPCPPSGIHHYRFMLSALDKELNLPEGTDRDTLESAMENFVIERAELVGQFSRDLGGATAEEDLQ